MRIGDLKGDNFFPGVKVALRKGGRTIEATDVYVVSSAKIACRFNIPKNAAAGKWDLLVQNTDGQSATRAKAFTVTEAASKQHTWYLAEGSTRWGFSTYITIENPNESGVHAKINYNTDRGSVPGGTVTLPKKSQATVNPSVVLGERDFSTRVVCREGRTIAVDRTMTWTGEGAPSPGAHSSIGVTSPARTWYLPEGSSAWGFETWLLIQNPGSKDATCQVTYMIEGEGPRTVEHRVPANSRRTYSMAEDIGARDASVKVTSNVPVIPERAMYRNSRREGHDSIGTTSPSKDYYLAEGTTGWGFTTYVLIQNPDDAPADVDVTYMTGAGQVSVPTFQMAPQSRKTINVNETATLPDPNFSTRVHGSRPIIAERAMYWNNGTGEACQIPSA